MMREALQQHLAALSITPRTVSHPPVRTVEEAAAHYADIPGAHTKNLFLKDAKGALFLVTLPATRQLDMKALPPLIGSKKLSFGSPDLMRETLATEPGSLGPLSLIADTEHRVRFAIDTFLLLADDVTCHPMDNRETWIFKPSDLRRFWKALGVQAIEISFPA